MNVRTVRMFDVVRPARSPAIVARGLVIGLLVVTKLALVHGRLLCPRALPHDDLLFVRLAERILATGWLGPYDETTLVKGPFYPLFLAGNSLLSMPLLLTQELLYVLATGLLVLALSPLVRNRSVLVVLFAACLFNPGTYSPDTNVWAGTTAVVTREGLYTVLTMLAFAGMIGLWANREGRIGHLLLWALCLGGALGPFWLTREEGVWLVPSLALALGATGWHLVKRSRGRAALLSYLGITALPVVMWGLAMLAVATLNHMHYGVFTTNELFGRPFKAAYGALTRVEHPNWVPNIPVPREVRLQIYRESPAFRELQGYLESPMGWYSYNCTFYPQTCGDIAGSCFLWAFREGVARLGYYRSARKAADYYQRLAREVNEACSSGRLRCEPARATLLDPVHWDHLTKLPAVLARELMRTITFSDVFVGRCICDLQDKSMRRLFWEVTHEDFVPLCYDSPLPKDTMYAIAGTYQKVMPFLVPVAMLGFFLSVWFGIRGKPAPLFLPAMLLLLGIGDRFFVLAVADVLTGTPYFPRYYLPCLALLIIFVTLNIYSFAQCFRCHKPR